MNVPTPIDPRAVELVTRLDHLTRNGKVYWEETGGFEEISTRLPGECVVQMSSLKQEGRFIFQVRKAHTDPNISTPAIHYMLTPSDPGYMVAHPHLQSIFSVAMQQLNRGKEDVLNTALDAVRKGPPPPQFPPVSIIHEDKAGTCPKCGSSEHRKWLFGPVDGCYQPLCPRYYRRSK
jgi:hypothetical protein